MLNNKNINNNDFFFKIYSKYNKIKIKKKMSLYRNSESVKTANMFKGRSLNVANNIFQVKSSLF